MYAMVTLNLTKYELPIYKNNLFWLPTVNFCFYSGNLFGIFIILSIQSTITLKKT